MKHVCWLPLLGTVVIASLAGCGYPASAHIEFQKTASFDGVERVSIETGNGRIELRGEPGRSDVDIRGSTFARGMTHEDARDAAEQITIVTRRAAENPRELQIVAEIPPDLRDRSPGANFVIAAPPGAEFRLETSNGSVDVRSVEGPVHVSTSNGGVRVEHVRGSADVETSNGGIVLRDVSGDVQARSTNGGIRLESVGLRQVTARTTNGGIVAESLRGAARVRTSNGPIDLAIAEAPENPSIEAVSSNGWVAVELPETIDARLTMRTSNGRVQADLKNAQVRDFHATRHGLEATLNDGGGTIVIATTNGSARVRTAPPPSKVE